MKLYISSDIEGTAGIATWEETTRGKAAYEYYAEQMSREVAAACEGAFQSGKVGPHPRRHVQRTHERCLPLQNLSSFPLPHGD